MQDPKLPLVCDLAALVPDGAKASPAALRDARERAERVSAEVFGSAVAVRELPDGDRIQLRDAPGSLVLAAEFIEIDRRCCGFLRHALTVDVGGTTIWLEIFDCYNEICGASHQAASAAVAKGWKNVARMPAGIRGWEAAGMTIER